MRRLGLIFTLILLAALWTQQARSQTTTLPGSTTQAVGGVWITPDGMLKMRQRSGNLALRRTGDPSLTYVSLPRAFEELKRATESGTGASRELLTLRGLTRIEYVFVYPAEHDIVIAGQSEPLIEANPLQPLGRISGRPAVQLEDLVVAMRAIETNGGNLHNAFGCSLDMAPNAQQIANDIGQKYAATGGTKLADELKKALGPQKVRIIGLPQDSRMATAMVCADYYLKRMGLGLDPVPGVGNALGSGIASNRMWFEPEYEPLGVSPDGLSYHITGPRLKVEAGPQDFVKTGATPSATAFAKRFSTKMPEVAAKLEAVADLQNLADLLSIAALIRKDRLEDKAGVDFSWVRSDVYKVASLPVPQTAETLVNDNGALVAEGGVLLTPATVTEVDRATDEKTAVVRARPESSWFLTRPKAK